MIRIEVEDYCQQCLDFTPDVTKPEREIAKSLDGTSRTILSDTIIHCKYRKRCAGITRYLEQRVKGDANV